MIDAKEQYRRLCDSMPIPLHSRYWWMQATAIGKDWEVISLYDAERQPIAMLPVHLFCRYGIKCVLMPPHTQLSWLWVAPKKNLQKVYGQFVQTIDRYVREHHLLEFYIQGYFDPDLLKVFKQEHFIVKERISYRIPYSTADSQYLLQSFSTNKQRLIRKAIKSGIMMTDLSITEFYHVHTLFLKKRNKTIDYTEDFFYSLASEAIARNQGHIFAAQDCEKRILAAVFLVWDDSVCYYLLPTYNPDYPNSGAMAWLTLQSILFARKQYLAFDFEGSMNPSIANSYAQFGSEKVIYHSVEKTSRLFKLMVALNNFIHWLQRL